MNTNIKMKYCKGCDKIKPITEYYKAGKSFQSRCKPCHIIHRRELRQAKPKPKKEAINPFQKLPDEQKQEILKYLGTMPLTKLSKRVGINRNTMATWKSKGYLN